LVTAIEASGYNFDGKERHPHFRSVRVAFSFKGATGSERRPLSDGNALTLVYCFGSAADSSQPVELVPSVEIGV